MAKKTQTTRARRFAVAALAAALLACASPLAAYAGDPHQPAPSQGGGGGGGP